MKELKYILMDLDGTITDPMQSITSSAAYALAKFGISVEDLSTLQCFIGPPLTVSFQQYFGFDEKQALDGLRYYREHYSVNGLDGNIPYDGIAELLAELKKSDKTVILATSKPIEYAEEILRRNDLIGFFDFVSGNDLHESRPTKQQVIEYIIEQYSDISSENTIMVGDRMYDVEGAHEYGLKCAAVLYGYGSREDLEECGADYILSDVAELRELLLGE